MLGTVVRMGVACQAILVCACGGDSESAERMRSDKNASGGAGSPSGDSSAGGGDSSASEGGSAVEGGGGSGGAPTQPCKVVSGELAYGPIGEPYPLGMEEPPGHECKLTCATVEGELRAIADSRGVVVQLLDEAGMVQKEELLSSEPAERLSTRFSRNGDRVLVTYQPESYSPPALYAVLDLRGTLLGQVQPLGDGSIDDVFDVAVTTRAEGWLVATSSVRSSTWGRGVLLTEVSRDGLLGKRATIGADIVGFSDFHPSAYGGSLLVGNSDTGGMYAMNSSLIWLIDDSLAAAYKDGEQEDVATSWPQGIIDDPAKDLVVIQPLGTSEEALLVQEYGCLD